LKKKLEAAKAELETRDSDRDGILDRIEKKVGLDPHNPNDAKQDKDNDGFTNIEEVLGNKDGIALDRSSDLADAKDHPSLSYRLSLEPKDKRSTLFQIKDVNVKTDKVSDRTVTIKYRAKTEVEEKQFKVYDSFVTDGITYTVNEIRRKKKKVFSKAAWKELSVIVGEVELKSSKTELLVMYKGDKKLKPASPIHKAKDSHTGKVFELPVEGTIKLGDELTGPESFKVIRVDRDGAVLLNTETGKSFTVKEK